MNGWVTKLATFQRRSVTIDEGSGTEVESWNPIVYLPGSPAVGEKFWVKFRDVKPTRAEIAANDLVVARNQGELVMRWRDDITSDLRVVIHNETDTVYQIIGGPAEVNGRKIDIQMLLERYSNA